MFKNVLLASTLGLSIYALAANANAAHRPQGWYLGIEGGANWIDDADVGLVGAAPVNWDAAFDSGWAAFVDVGYRFESNWRLELEAGWRENDVNCISTGGPCVVGTWGQVDQFTPMLNLVHDFDISERTALSIGLGVGGDLVEARNTPIPLRDNDDWVFAAQLLVQLTHQLTDRLDFVLTYRLMSSEDPTFERFGAPGVQFENLNHTVTVGLRFDLQADAEPMEPPTLTSAPPPEPPPTPRQFIVYFGFNKSSLTPEALEVVKGAAAAAQRDGFASILVTGHTDTSGSATYNQRLSERRAATVKDALVNEGIPAAGITATGKGQTQLEVQTSDHQREPRNRRATIDIEQSGAGEAQPSAPAPEAPVHAPQSESAPAAPAEPSSAAPTTPAPTTPAAPPAKPAAKPSSGLSDATATQYRAWIAEARAKHPYPDSEERMFGVLLCESRGNAAIVNPAGPYYGLFQYKMETWKGAWNDYRNQDVKDAHAQIFATAQAWQRGMQRQWGCYSHPH